MTSKNLHKLIFPGWFFLFFFWGAFLMTGCSFNSGSNDSNGALAGLQTCPSGSLFSRAPIDKKDVVTLGTLGSFIPPDHTFPTPHMYFYVLDTLNSGNAADKTATIYAPADMTLTEIGLRHYDTIKSKTNYTMYDLVFSVCSDVEIYFIHVVTITHPSIIAALQAGGCTPSGAGINTGAGTHEQSCSFNVSVSIKAGEALGTAGDKDAGVYGMDVGLRDYRLAQGRSSFANPDRWCDASVKSVWARCYTACFLDYLDPDTVNSYQGLFTNQHKTIYRTEEPFCGTISLDLAGTAQGYWFPTSFDPSQLNGPEELDLFMGPDNLKPSYDLFSMGRYVTGLSPGTYTFAPKKLSVTSGRINRKFSEINDDQIYCFDTLYASIDAAVTETSPIPNLALVLQLSSNKQTVTVEKQTTASCGEGPWSFTGNAVTFER